MVCEICEQVHERCAAHKLSWDGKPLRPCRAWPLKDWALCRMHFRTEMGGYAPPVNIARLDEPPSPPRPPRRRSTTRVDKDGVCLKCGQVHERCAGHKGNGSPCGLIPRFGLRVCRRHGGNTPQAIAKSERAKKQRELAVFVEGPYKRWKRNQLATARALMSADQFETQFGEEWRQLNEEDNDGTE